MEFIKQTSGNFKVGDYFHSAKAFDAMERIEPNPEYWEGKRGAVIGVFKLVAEHSAPPYVNDCSIEIHSNDYIAVPLPLPFLLPRLSPTLWAILGEFLFGFSAIKISERFS